jgi:hypothetical protein
MSQQNLHKELRELVNVIPPAIKSGGSIQQVREWKKHHKAALKVALKKKPNDIELASQIAQLKNWMSNGTNS